MSPRFKRGQGCPQKVCTLRNQGPGTGFGQCISVSGFTRRPSEAGVGGKRRLKIPEGPAMRCGATGPRYDQDLEDWFRVTDGSSDPGYQEDQQKDGIIQSMRPLG